MRQKGKGLSGMLVYPEVGRSLRLRYRLLGIPVMIATVDLSQAWRDIEAELHGLLDDCASAANLPSQQEADHGSIESLNAFAVSPPYLELEQRC
jgi:5-methylcytosine-specific restriction enzyme subunit McrC